MFEQKDAITIICFFKCFIVVQRLERVGLKPNIVNDRTKQPENKQVSVHCNVTLFGHGISGQT